MLIIIIILTLVVSVVSFKAHAIATVEAVAAAAASHSGQEPHWWWTDVNARREKVKLVVRSAGQFAAGNNILVEKKKGYTERDFT